MTKEELKALGVTDEAADKIVEDYGKNYVSKAQFNATNEEKKAAKTELAQIKTELDGLKEKAKGNEDLSKQIEDLKKQSEAREKEYAQKVKNMEIDGIVDRALLTAKAKSVKAVRALLDLNGAEVEDGKIKGLDKQIEKLVTEAGYLFGDGKPNVKGATPGDPGGNTPKSGVTKEQFNKMSYSERVQLYNDDKEAYDRLTTEGE
jgi:phage minor structural protein GP20|nr:MAG TPA: minor structural protein [Caudoviricetes sp.]